MILGPVQPSSDSLVVSQIEASYSSTYLAKLTFQDGTIVFLTYALAAPFSNPYWYIRWGTESGSLSCSAGSRDLFCPGCTVNHYWATSLYDSWSTFSISDGSYQPGSATFWVNGANCSQSNVCNCTINSTFGFDSNLTSAHLLVPDVRMTPISSQNSSNWMLLPDSLFYIGTGSSCGTLDVNMFDFYHQPDFCNSSFSSCILQLGSFITNFI